VSVGHVVHFLRLLLVVIFVFIDSVILTQHASLVRVVQLRCRQQEEVCIPLLQTTHIKVMVLSQAIGGMA